jgi:hypothetical protein
VSITDADGNCGEHNGRRFTYSTNSVAPVLSNQRARSVHYGDDSGNYEYALYLGIQVADPQGLSDIASVVVTGPSGKAYTIKDNSDSWYETGFGGFTTPPQIGNYTFRVTDKSGNWAEKVDSVTANLDYPRNVHPVQNEVVSTSTPTFSWNGVQGTITYYVWVNNNYGKQIWLRGNITSTSVVYNDDGNSNENLKDGSTYNWSVRVTDADGNWGEQYNRRFTYSTNPTKPNIGNHYAVTYHGGDDRGGENYGYNFWVDVTDPQGNSDIASVIFKPSGGIDYKLTDANGDGRYEGGVEGFSTPSLLGQCIFTVTDKSNNTATAFDTLSAWMPYARNVHPVYNEVVSTSTPLFSWDSVGGAVRYSINVGEEGGPVIWGIDVYNRTTLTYNEDGKGPTLIEGKGYWWQIYAYDNKGNLGHHYQTKFAYSTNSVAPVLTNPTALSVHYGDDIGNQSYNLVLRSQVADPQGLSDIASVVVTGPDGKIYIIKDDNNDGYYETWFGSSTELPQLGKYTFRVTDKSGNWTEGVDSVTANLDYPKNVHPVQNEVVSTSAPTFSWNSVQGAITYTLWIDDLNGKRIWTRSSLTSASVVYNDDGNANENLKDGSTYTWYVNGNDADGNWGEHRGCRFTYSTNPTSPKLNNAQVRSRHWVGGDFSESWGIDCWVYVSDPQGLSDIDSVWVDGPSNYHLRLYDDGNHSDDNNNDGKYAQWIGGVNIQPTIGEYI